MTERELKDRLNSSYKDKTIEVQFVIGMAIKKPYSRARFMESGTTQNLSLTPVEGSQKACIQLYP